MKTKSHAVIRFAIFAVAFVMAMGLSVIMTGQEAPGQGTAWVDDWTHHRLVFSHPGTEQDAIKNRTHDRWYDITHDPRYRLQQAKRSHPQQAVAPAVAAAPADFATRLAAAMATRPTPVPVPKPKPKGKPIKQDWSTGLNGVAASRTGTVSSNGATVGATVTVGGQALTASAPTAATRIGTFSSLPTTGAAITVTNGSNVLTLTTNATASHATGTFAKPPLTSTSISVTSGANTLAMTTNGTGSHAIGTFAATPTAGTSISINSNANALTLTTNATPGTAVGTFGSTSGVGSTVTITYSGGASSNVLVLTSQSSGSNSCTSATAGKFVDATNTTTAATNITTAINACYASFPAVGVTASHTSGATFTVTAVNPGPFLAVSETFSSGFSWGTISGNSAGSNTCAGTTGTFATAPSGTAGGSAAGLTALASNLFAAINACPASAGVSATSSTNTVTVTDTTPGSFTTFSVGGGASGIFTWGGVTAGTNGSASCAGTAGTFITDSNTTNLATNLAAAIAVCPASAGITVTSSTNNVTVTSIIPGTTSTSPFSVTATNNSGIYTWGSVSGGSDGSGSCSGTAPTFTGTYQTSSSTSTLASLLHSAITACPAAAGITSVPSSNTVTITARIAGTGGNSISLTPTSGFFAWAGSTLVGGSDGTQDGTHFAYWSVNAAASTSQLATNIARAINDNATLQSSAGVTASSSGNVITVTARATGTSGNSIGTTASMTGFAWTGTTLAGGAAGTGRVQPNTYPAKFGASLTSADCSDDFIVYPTGMAGAAGAASIIAYNNLYTSGCSGAVPSVYWAYNTGGTVTTSPIISFDANGSQVAFVQVTGTAASLVLLKWAANTTETLGAPLTLTTQASAPAYRGCSAPCMYTLALGANDTFSAPFYDYGHDYIYVGDDSGNLHQFTGVFNGNPAESGSPWPVHLGANKLSSPVYDTEYGYQGGYVFVGDFGGVFYSVGTGFGGTTAGLIQGNSGSLGDAIADAPLVNSGDGTVFVFVTTNGPGKPYAGDNAVWQFVSSFVSYGGQGVVYVGVGGAGYYLYAGAFDNVYYDSGNPASGHLYVVGNTGTAGGGTLYQVGIAYSSLTGTVNIVDTGINSTGRPWPSPVTEFCNNGADPCSLSQRTATGNLSTTSPNVTLTSGTFTGADLGAQIWASPSNILYGKVITSVLSSTTADLEFGVFANATGQTFTIQDGVTTSGTDYIFFSVNRGTGLGCTNAAGNGCVLSYNVSNTFHAATGKTNSSTSVTSTTLITAADVGGTIVGVGIPAGATITAYNSGTHTATLSAAATATSAGTEPLTITPLLAQTGNGLNVTTPGTNGCWATGGLIIDNSDTTTTGASQIYFVNLNGAAAGGTTGVTSPGCTAGTAPLNGVQASQASP